MSKELTNEELKQLVDIAINEVKMLLYGWQETPSNKKRAGLLSYWLRDYVKYLKNETKFSPTSLKEYSRGDIVKVNLGFNVGSEEGGLHYAIVVNNCNARHAPTINVIPLTSKKEGKEVHEDDIFLGNEIYEKLKTKYQHEDNALKDKISELEEQNEYVENQIAEFSKVIDEVKEENNIPNHLKVFLQGMLSDIMGKANDIEQELISAKKALKGLQKLINEISNMKTGSIALVSQITTVSKMKIYDPKSENDVLAGIKLSNKSLDLLNEKMKQVFIR